MGKKSRRKQAESSRPPAEQPRQAAWNPAVLIAAGLFLLIIVIYAQVYDHQFIDFDDPLYVSGNEHVLRGLTWSGVGWAFTHIHAAYWHPVTWLSHMLDVQLFGPKAGAHLLVSMLLHAINSVLVFVFLRKATGALWRSAMVAALFAVHPLHVESVAWVAERKDTLSTLFFLLCLIAYVQYVATAARRFYVASVAALALGLMSKPMLVTTPFVLLLIDDWPLRRFGTIPLRKLLLEKIPFAVCMLPSIGVTLVAQRGAMSAVTFIPLAARLANAAMAYVKYVAKTLWPSGLAVIYPFPTHLSMATAAACAVAIVVVTIAAFLCRRDLPWFFVGWLWFAGTLVPVSGIVQVGQQAMADRFTYIPHIGLFLAVVWSLALAVQRMPVLRKPAAALAALVILVLTGVAHAQVRYWSNSVTLFRHALQVTSSDNKVAHIDLAAGLLAEGDYAGAEREYRAVGPNFQPAYTAHYGLALALFGEGKLDAAAQEAHLALQADPNSAEALSTLGSIELARGNASGAQNALARSLQIRNDPAVAARLAVARGDLQGAREQFARAVAANPADADAHNALAAVLAKSGDDAGAEREYAEALRLNPKLYDARMNYGALLSRSGRDDAAAQQFSEAAAVRPESPEPLVYLGLLDANRNDFAAAARRIERAIAADHDTSNRILVGAIRIPPRPTAIDEYLAFLRQRSAAR